MDPFALLSSGARFDKRKKPAAPGTKPAGVFTVAQPLPQQQQQQQSRKKRKKQHGGAAAAAAGGDDDQDADASAGISLFGSSHPQQQSHQQRQQQQQELPLPEVHTKDPFEEANVIRKALRIKVCGSVCGAGSCLLGSEVAAAARQNGGVACAPTVRVTCAGSVLAVRLHAGPSFRTHACVGVWCVWVVCVCVPAGQGLGRAASPQALV
jgi:hypothetical protein